MRPVPLAIALTGALGVTIALAAPPDGQPTVREPRTEQGTATHSGGGDANRGRMLAVGGLMHALRFSCSQCHGMDGSADASGAFPRLAGQSAWYLYASLRNFASGARPSPAMGPVAIELTDEDMQDLAAYYSSIGKAAYPPPLPPERAALTLGQSIAATGLPQAGVPACASCHGDKGLGQAPLYPYLAGQYEAYLEQQLRAFKTGKRMGDPGGVMRNIAARLSDEQIHAVAVYFDSLRAEQPVPATSASAVAAEKLQPPQPLPMRTGAAPNPKPVNDKVVLPAEE